MGQWGIDGIIHEPARNHVGRTNFSRSNGSSISKANKWIVDQPGEEATQAWDKHIRHTICDANSSVYAGLRVSTGPSTILSKRPTVDNQYWF
ncbi:hypothetical protein NSMS1_60710 (plasmid) [Nostoc sp. MS1]|nr:hypothetical protein NSMS1_60710 [Nostoc sp. MS1]